MVDTLFTESVQDIANQLNNNDNNNNRIEEGERHTGSGAKNFPVSPAGVFETMALRASGNSLLQAAKK